MYISRFAARRQGGYNRLAILQRLLRLEEKLKAQRLLFEARFAEIDKRFENMNKRSEDINSRFEAVNKPFEDINDRFEDLNKRFEDDNKRFEDLNKRFEDGNRWFETPVRSMDSRFNQLTWIICTGFVVLVLLITLFGFLH